jgi:quercetin dioxygenase-like cupin family protein
MSKIKKVLKVWGEEIWMANTNLYCGKLLKLNQGKRCSVHYHKNKDETFYVLSGRVLMELWKKNNVKTKIMREEEIIRINPKTKHRFSGLEDSIIIEISTHHEDENSYRTEISGEVPLEIMRKYDPK